MSFLPARLTAPGSEDDFEIETTFRCFNMTDLSHLHLRLMSEDPAEYCDELYGPFDVLRRNGTFLASPQTSFGVRS